MSNLNELERKQKELMAAAEAIGAEIERLKRAEDIEIKYAFSVYISNTSVYEDHNACVFVWGEINSDIKKPRTILEKDAADDFNPYGFSRAYLVGDEVIVIANNGDDYEELHTMSDCETPPTPEVQSQHKEIIRKYLANRPKESRTFRVEDIDKAWERWTEALGFEFEMVDSVSSYFSDGKKYSAIQNYFMVVDDDDDLMSPRDKSIIKLSPALYQALKPYLDLSKTL